jgi:hypothetical protein
VEVGLSGAFRGGVGGASPFKSSSEDFGVGGGSFLPFLLGFRDREEERALRLSGLLAANSDDLLPAVLEEQPDSRLEEVTESEEARAGADFRLGLVSTSSSCWIGGAGYISSTIWSSESLLFRGVLDDGAVLGEKPDSNNRKEEGFLGEKPDSNDRKEEGFLPPRGFRASGGLNSKVSNCTWERVDSCISFFIFFFSLWVRRVDSVFLGDTRSGGTSVFRGEALEGSSWIWIMAASITRSIAGRSMME